MENKPIGSKEIIEDMHSEVPEEIENFGSVGLNQIIIRELRPSPLPLTQEMINNGAKVLINLVHDGHAKATDVASRLEFIIKVAKQAIDGLNDAVCDELEKNGGKDTVNGLPMEKIESGVKYDYSMCGSSEYHRLKSKRDSLDFLIKEKEKFLKTLTKSTGVVNEDGVVEELYPPQRSSTTTYKVKFAK